MDFYSTDISWQFIGNSIMQHTNVCFDWRKRFHRKNYISPGNRNNYERTIIVYCCRNRICTFIIFCLCFSLNLSNFQKVTVKQVSKREDDSWLGYAGGCLCIGVIIVIMVLAWFGLEKWGCEHKKAQGFAGYKNRQCWIKCRLLSCWPWEMWNYFNLDTIYNKWNYSCLNKLVLNFCKKIY